MTDNILQNIDFSFTIKRLGMVSYMVREANVPGLNATPVSQANPSGGSIWRHGGKLEHDNLAVTFYVDEGLENWMEVYGWLVGLYAPQFAAQYTELADSPDGLYSDATLIINSSAKNPLHQFTFKNMHPIGLTEIKTDATTESGENVMIATATFAFDYFEYKRLRKA